MGWLKKKSNPLTDRQEALSKQIASLEAEIKRLDSKMNRGGTQPRAHSAGGFPRAPAQSAPTVTEARPTPPVSEPVFEDVSQERLHAPKETANPKELYNELGVRKYD